jgi:hypothetical protein
METTLIILAGINILVAAGSPVILATAFLIKNIKRSSCCGGSLEMKTKEDGIYEVVNPNINYQNENIKSDTII